MKASNDLDPNEKASQDSNPDESPRIFLAVLQTFLTTIRSVANMKIQYGFRLCESVLFCK